jgi:hypothetical protein
MPRANPAKSPASRANPRGTVLATSMLAMSRMALVLVPLLLAACGPGGIEADDDAGVEADGRADPSGLRVRWTAPDLGEQLGPCVLERLRMELHDLRVIGDAAPEATYLASHDLDLPDAPKTAETEFGDAPPGRYSAFEFAIDRPGDGDEAWLLLGEVTVDGDSYDLEIEDEVTSSISLPFAPDLTLSAGETAVITVEIDLARVVADIDWVEQLPDDGGERISIDDDSSELPAVRQRLRLAFRVASIDVE